MSDPLEDCIFKILHELGEDTDREGLKRTPERVAKSLRFLTKGYDLDVKSVFENAVFEAENFDEMVLLKDIEMYSMCEHHLLPFFGKCHISYVPRKKIIGLSKIPRIVEVFARRLQVQERMTTQIAYAIKDALEPYGVGVIIEAYHLCMMMRGVEKQNCETLTSCMLGVYKSDPRTRAEFLSLIRKK
ncbi:MAG: GTP cyclohydrolase I FolE [Candidatus Schekmanbacteria bacterium RBG_13_48_7]|uniref:GTP cyclohydrolase 1 n=1 Tax=Candidatus Schekmanbacteria bacterium RBG_13_48_7 TaxID=1817878 RepID=A0A1F7RL31_9BACT|nr:MAG: GTP cyclohydrolase I FolE [Candidatus Schekmanbacteria bacterium RBG_13_48_7]